jgi:hypothetical protein
MNKEDMEKDKTLVHTHLEIHESLIFGMMCNLINFPENNPFFQDLETLLTEKFWQS